MRPVSVLSRNLCWISSFKAKHFPLEVLKTERPAPSDPTRPPACTRTNSPPSNLTLDKIIPPPSPLGAPVWTTATLELKPKHQNQKKKKKKKPIHRFCLRFFLGGVAWLIVAKRCVTPSTWLVRTTPLHMFHMHVHCGADRGKLYAVCTDERRADASQEDQAGTSGTFFWGLTPQTKGVFRL